MGKGKGKVERYYAGVAAGDIFYEMKTTKALAVKEVYDRLKVIISINTGKIIQFGALLKKLVI